MYFFMAQDNQLQMPGMFGGMTRYNEEFHSKFAFSPRAVIAFLISIITFVVMLKVFWPVSA